MTQLKPKRSSLPARLHQFANALAERLRAHTKGGRHSTRPARIVRRLLAMWRAHLRR